MKSSPTSPWLEVSIVAAAFAMTALAYPALPAVIPTHWNAAGVADGFMSKTRGAFVLPAVMAAMALFLAVLPRVSPRGFEMSGFASAYTAMRRGVLLFLLYVHALALYAGLGHEVSMTVAVFAGAGILLALLGNYLGKVRKNFFVGIRTPWTLASDEVWERTHRFGGRLWVAGGLTMCAVALAGKVLWALPIVALLALVPVAYSYVVYRRLHAR